MSDAALSHFKPLDPGRVDVDDPVERQYWCQELRCTEAELIQALGTVGNHITVVRDYLASGR